MPSSHFSYRDGVLQVEKASLPVLAQHFGTPLYVYSRRTITQAWQGFARPLASTPHLACYAVKANGTLSILQLLARLGAGFDIVSVGELQRVLRVGGDPQCIVFSGVGKRTDELLQALDAGIRCFNVESETELLRLNELALARGTRAAVALRINPDVASGTHPHVATGHGAAKFGIDPARAEALALNMGKLPGIRLTGLACHVGSQLVQAAPWRAAAQRLTQLADRLAARGIALAHLDFGGGFPVRYRDESLPDTDALLKEFRALAEARGLDMLIEPGRAIVAGAGVLLTRAEYVKPTPHGRFVIVDAGMTELIRPALYDAWHEIRAVTSRAEAKAEWCDVVGPVCESADFLAHDRRLAVQAGDLLAVMDAGAYGFSMSSNYNSRPRAAEVLVDGEQVTLIRRRETLDDLMAQEDLLPE